jgi:hypothetical protein
METNNEQHPRQIKDAPFCWQHKDVLRMITETFSESDQAVSARSLYVALSELASDNESQTFTATKALIAHKAALSISTVQRLLNGFEQLGVVQVKRNLEKQTQGAIKSPNTYTLLSIGHSDLTSIGHRGQSSNPDKVEEKRRKKNKRLRVDSHKSSESTHSFVPKIPYPETEEEMYETLEAMGIDPNPDYDGGFFDDMQSRDWTLPDGRPVYDWPATYVARLEKTSPEYR